MKRYTDNDSGPGTGLRCNCERSTRQFSTLAHAMQAQTRFHGRWIEASSGIHDAQLKPLTCHGQLHPNIGGVCMLGDVSERFLGDSVETSPYTARNVDSQPVRIKRDRNSFAL